MESVWILQEGQSKHLRGCPGARVSHVQEAGPESRRTDAPTCATVLSALARVPRAGTLGSTSDQLLKQEPAHIKQQDETSGRQREMDKATTRLPYQPYQPHQQQDPDNRAHDEKENWL